MYFVSLFMVLVSSYLSLQTSTRVAAGAAAFNDTTATIYGFRSAAGADEVYAAAGLKCGYGADIMFCIHNGHYLVV